MPTYDYECAACGENHRLQHAMSADTPDCPACGGSLDQVFLTAPAIGGTNGGSGASADDFPACEAPACATGTCPYQ